MTASQISIDTEVDEGKRAVIEDIDLEAPLKTCECGKTIANVG